LKTSFEGLSLETAQDMAADMFMMSTMSLEDRHSLYNDLMTSVRSCSERGMYQSAKWFGTIPFFIDVRAAEALNSMDREGLNGAGQSMSIDSGQSRKTNQKQLRVEMDREAQDLPKYLLAKSYFDCKEFDRAAFVLADSQSLKSKFLRLYSKYLVCPLDYTTHLRLGKNERRKMVKRFLVYA
jgi:anaphase-promoting complex subunit 8